MAEYMCKTSKDEDSQAYPSQMTMCAVSKVRQWRLRAASVQLKEPAQHITCPQRANRRIHVKEIAHKLNISIGSALDIVLNTLGYQKMCSR